MLVHVSLLRYAAPLPPTNPCQRPTHRSGSAVLLPVEMKDHMRKFVLALALVSSTSAAFAQQAAPQRQGTEQEQTACRRDVQRHCRSVIDQGDFTILACLKENRPKISAACDQVLKSHGQ